MADILDLLSDARVHVTLVGGFILAVCATVHILLTKREVASAVGWIGLVWLASFLGLAIYLVFGVNRVRRRARQVRGTAGDLEAGNRGHSLEVPDGLAALGRGVGRITGAPLVRASDVVVLHNGDEAYAPMLAAIEAARHSVGLSSYIFRNDVWGGQFIEALIAAHRRGVAVRVLIDGIGGGWLLSPTYHRLRRAGVPAARFMHSPLPWRMPFINLRCHKKILVVDGTHGFTGGLNIGDENVAATRPAHPVQDMHFRIEGQVVGQLARAFAADWQFATGEELTGEAWFPPIQEEDGVLARVIDSGPDEDIEKVEFAVLQAVACARQTVQIMTPYFLPDERLVTALALAAMRGVAVEVILPERGNHILVDWASRANVGPLLDAGVRLSQSPPPFHHAKLMVVDGVWCLIGSCNWDIRSFRLNFELCVEIYDEGLARVLGAVMTGARGAALTAEDIARLPLPIRLRDAAARLMLPYL